VDSKAHKAATRIAYERLAEVWADTDDNLWNDGLVRSAVRRLLPQPLAEARVLDAGCASGAHSAWLASQGCHVVAIDLSPSMVRQARARLDGIVCSLSLHYLSDMASTLRQCAQLLRPPGWLIVTLDHPFGTVPGDDDRDYFSTRLVTDTWEKRGVEVTQAFWRRPLGAVVDDFADAGFVIERIDEPRVDATALERFGSDAARIEGRPTFIGYLARRRAVT
jgi:SAM-dependent methyltransferase